MCLERSMESCWDGWVCMREMLEITEELSEKKAMDLIQGSSFTKYLATDSLLDDYACSCPLLPSHLPV